MIKSKKLAAMTMLTSARDLTLTTGAMLYDDAGSGARDKILTAQKALNEALYAVEMATPSPSEER